VRSGICFSVQGKFSREIGGGALNRGELLLPNS
jgi:hypothetical protein